MRHFILSATLAATLGLTAPLSGAVFVGSHNVQSVELQQVVDAPYAFSGQRVKFHATFIELTQIYDPTHTPFTPERFLNFAVWDDEARIYDPEVRAKPLVTFYFDKRVAAESKLMQIGKYDLVEIVADVSATSDTKPWFNVVSIRKSAEAPTYNDSAIYHVEQANALAKDGAYDLADARFASALKEKLPSHATIAIQELRARNQMAAGNFPAAAKVLSSALAIQQDKDRDGKGVDVQSEARLHYLAAKSQGEIAEDVAGPEREAAYQAAVKHARESIALDPTQGDSYAVLGIALAGLGQYDDARRECAQAIRLQPTNAEVRWYLGRILDLQGAHDEAIEALKKAIDLTPKDSRVHRAIAAAYHHRAQKGGAKASEDLSTAMREYDIALRLNAADVESAYESALVLQTAVDQKVELQLGTEKVKPTADTVIARLQAALKIDAKHAPTQIELSKRFAAAGRVDDSIALMTTIIAAEPDRRDAVQELSRLQLGKGQADAALATLESYRASHPNDNAILAEIGRTALAAGKPEAGIPALELLTKNNPKHVAGQLDLADCYIKVGRAKEGVRRARVAADYATKAEDKARAEALSQAQ